MKKHLIVALLFGCLFTATGCSGVGPSSSTGGRIPPPVATSIPQATAKPAEPALTPPASSEGTTAYRLMNSCSLLNSRDIASLFSSAEVTVPVHHVGQVNHVVFSTQGISATESSCIDYAFHKPGSKDMELLQVTYWVDLPNQAAFSAWTKVWTKAKSKAAQAVSNIGEDAFYDNGRLTFKEGDLFVTTEVVGTDLNTDTQAGVTRQIEIEKQLALDELSRATTS